MGEVIKLSRIKEENQKENHLFEHMILKINFGESRHFLTEQQYRKLLKHYQNIMFEKYLHEIKNRTQ
ncbi:hypothetical protein [Fredinandcohnia quinoae]|uniref:Uncharacterized protein n=1 Tax=Fredinandcohnia quinoae TaxID=2918902 RepID=A0AAW5E9B4_9BACI|nr:hypothetical protein [Fredinandcohnia sp. SECRCQ15]MCH1626245.1 hypothetical protein [Fredinandcohnia sp. SECRCQ15]